jgi:hypothetical protein
MIECLTDVRFVLFSPIVSSFTGGHLFSLVSLSLFIHQPSPSIALQQLNENKEWNSNKQQYPYH